MQGLIFVASNPVRLMIQRTMMRLGIKDVHACSTIADGKKSPPDQGAKMLVVSDLRLPDGDAFSVLQSFSPAPGSLLIVIEYGKTRISDPLADFAANFGIRVRWAHTPISAREIIQFATADSRTCSGIRASDDKNIALSGDDEPFVALQPQYNIRSMRLTGFEALTRWRRRCGTILHPGILDQTAFDDAMCDSGFVEMILGKACSALEQVHSFVPDITVSINTSVRFLEKSDAVSVIERTRKAFGLLPADITVEVTESERVEPDSQARITCCRLVLDGYGLSIDDYGTGDANLSRLQALPFTELKVDRRFVHAARDTKRTNLLRSCLRVAKDLGASTVAEGIETRQDLATVAELGFDVAQGYMLGKPAELERILEYLADPTRALAS